MTVNDQARAWFRDRPWYVRGAGLAVAFTMGAIGGALMLLAIAAVVGV